MWSFPWQRTRLVEELTEKNRLLVAENSELKRQHDEIYAQLNEQTSEASAAASGTVQVLDEPSKPHSHRVKLSSDAFLDAFEFLNRFNVDTAQITCHQWRYLVEEKLSTLCLRELLYVTVKRQTKPCMSESDGKVPYTDYEFDTSSWDGWGMQPLNADCIFLVMYGRRGDAVRPLRGNTQEETRHGLTFPCFDAASDFLQRLIRSSTIDDFKLKSLAPNDAFFEGLGSVAETVSVKKLTLSGCHLDGVDARSLHNALLQFQSVSKLVVGHRLLPAHISDDFLDDAVDKLALTRLRFDTDAPIGPEVATFDATDRGVMRFLFRPTKEDVRLQISHVNVSSTFCTELFLKALSEPAANDLFLAMRVRMLELDLTGILQWRLSSAGTFLNVDGDVYSVKNDNGKRLRLWIKVEPEPMDWRQATRRRGSSRPQTHRSTIWALEFRRCPWKEGAEWDRVPYDNIDGSDFSFTRGFF